MTAEEAATLRIDDELDYPTGWPDGGCNLALARPVKILDLARSSWSQTHVLVGLACANGKTTQADAGWFTKKQTSPRGAELKTEDEFAGEFA